MSTHTIDEAKGQLADLIDRALRGEGVVITRDDRPVVDLRPVPVVSRAAPSPSSVEAVSEWSAEFRRNHPKEIADAVALVREMREEGP